LDWIREIYDKIDNNIGSIYSSGREQDNILNIIDFVDKIIKIKLWKRQRFILKVFYSLPLNEDEKEEINWLKENKGIEIPENFQHISFKELVLVVGRRGSKSVLAALIACYEIYKLLNLYNPQKFYDLIPGTPIYILHVAAEEKQAEMVQDYIKGFIKGADWFAPYIDRIMEREVRFFSRFDKDTNYPKGTIRVYSLTSNSSSIPGRTAKVVILDELARMLDTKGRLAGDQIYDALTPSVKTFKDDGKIINISSPRTKAGIFYDLYLKSFEIESMLCFQYPTWIINPTLTREDFNDEFAKDPNMANMEYGAEFGEVLDSAFNREKINRMVELSKNRQINYIGQRNFNYVITCDPATIDDRYGIAWGHAEIITNHKYVVIDGLKYYESLKIKEGNDVRIEEVDLDEVDNFVIDLIRKLKNVSAIAYDQGKSTASIQKLKKMNYNAIETTFTNKYKVMLYSDMKNMLNQERLIIYEHDEKGAVNLFIDEIKHLEREIRGDTIKIGHPTIGKITTDDLYDCVSNLVHILLEENPKYVTKQINTRPRVVRIRRWG